MYYHYKCLGLEDIYIFLYTFIFLFSKDTFKLIKIASKDIYNVNVKYLYVK